jgi:hypothetical protein
LALIVLQNGTGGSLQVRLRCLEEVDGIVHGRVQASDLHGVGEFSGDLVVNPGGQEAPRLPLTVKMRFGFGWTFLAVAVGAVLAMLIRWRDLVGRRRAALRHQLKAALASYKEERKASGPSPASYDLEERTLGREPWDKPSPRVEGIHALRQEIDRASTDDEFAALQGKVDNIVEAIRLWLSLEPAARKAQRLLKAEKRRLSGTQIYARIDELLDDAGKADTPEEVESYLAELEDQVTLFTKLKELGESKEAVLRREGLSAQERRAVQDIDVQAIDRVSEEGHRVDGQATASDASPAKRLVTFLRTWLSRIVAAFATSPPPPPSDYESRLRRELSKASAALNKVAEGTEDEAASSKAPGRGRGFKETLRPAKWLWRITKKVWRWAQRRGVLAVLNARDLIPTLIVIFATAAAYAVTLYTDTWGAAIDFVTAFTAGFGVKASVDAIAPRIDWTSLAPVRWLLGPTRESKAPGGSVRQ